MKKTLRHFTDLEVWRQAHRLVVTVYSITNEFPQEERYGLGQQMRRAAVSVTSNIAEGFSRRTRKEKARFYDIAQGSASELVNQLLIARDVGFFDSVKAAEILFSIHGVQKMLTGLLKATRLPIF